MHQKALLVLCVKNYAKYAQWFIKHKSDLEVLMPSTVNDCNKSTPSQIGIVSAYAVPSNFVSAYTILKDNLSNVLMNALLQSFSAKMNLQMNDPYTSNLIYICQVIRHTLKSTYSFLR